MTPLVAQAVLNVPLLAYYAIALLVLGAIYYVFVSVVVLPPKVMQIVNVVLVVIAAIVAIKLLVSFL